MKIKFCNILYSHENFLLDMKLHHLFWLNNSDIYIIITC